MSDWKNICDYLLHSKDCENIHKLVWEQAGEAYITNPNMKRFKITDKNSLQEVKEMIATIREFGKVKNWFN